ncbi:hypothetical protein GCM10009665_09650 [Kitasatospora nipponensis]|uniref:Tail terminator n=1 Tax=Kitasatospora nipponensis TaxID=258049 RepID=A0ABN1VSP5_9ACTN
MTVAPTVFPDAERVIVDFLRNRTEFASATVDNKPPAGFDGTQAVVLVSRTGGVWIDDQHLDLPQVDLEVYGPDKTSAHALILLARAAVLQLRGTAYGTAQILDVVETDGPRWLPDYNRPAGNRYRNTVRLTVQPA